MSRLIIRLVINAVALWVASLLIEGVDFAQQGGSAVPTQDALPTIVVVALIFGLVNALIKPILNLITCPLQLITLGLITSVINALMLVLTSAIAQSFDQPFIVTGFVPALLGSIVIGVISFVLNAFFGDDDDR